MDLDLDMDFSEIFDDKVQTFLCSKLEEIQFQNEARQNTLAQHQQILDKIVQQPVQKYFNINNIWYKEFWGNFCVGFEISSSKDIRDIKVFIDSMGSQTLKVEIFTLEESETACAEKEMCQYIICGLVKKCDVTLGYKSCYVVVSFDFSFVCSRYDLSGFIICTLDDHQKINIPIPDTQISLTELRSSMWIKEPDSISNILSIVSCSNYKNNIMLRLPAAWTTPIMTTFEINFSLVYVPIKNFHFFVPENYQSYQLALIVHPHELNDGMKNDIFIKVYALDEGSESMFIDKLLSCIPGSKIICLKKYQYLLKEEEDCLQDKKNEQLEEFKQALESDIKHSDWINKTRHTLINMTSKNDDNLHQNLQALRESEKKTDIKYLQVSEPNAVKT